MFSEREIEKFVRNKKSDSGAKGMSFFNLIKNGIDGVSILLLYVANDLFADLSCTNETNTKIFVINDRAKQRKRWRVAA